MTKYKYLTGVGDDASRYNSNGYLSDKIDEGTADGFEVVDTGITDRDGSGSPLFYAIMIKP